MKKGYRPWFNSLSIEHQLEIFRRWRKITSNNKKHWSLNDLKKSVNDVSIILKELRNNSSSNFTLLDESIKGGILTL